MSSKGKGSLPSFMWETYRAMSVDVGRIIPFMRETACMNGKEREVVAYVDGFKLMFGGVPEMKTFIEFLEEVVKPFYIKLGQARWGRDVVSDLGFAKAGQRARVEKLDKIFDYDPERDGT